MADTYRQAATDCRFNLHVFNNSRDVVSSVPLGATHVLAEADFGNLNWNRRACAYHGSYTQSTGLSGMHLPSALNPLVIAAQAGANFALSRHDRNQWILSEPVSRLQHTPTSIAAQFFPFDDMGGLLTNVLYPGGRTEVHGIFDANLFNTTHGMYLRAVGGGGGDVRADRNVASTDELFRLTPGDSDCIRHASTITIRPVSQSAMYSFRGAFGQLNAFDWLYAKPFNMFTVINHTQQLGCIANNDVISLRTVDGMYVVAEPNGQANADRTVIGDWEKFTVRNVQNITAIPAPGNEGWQNIPGRLKQISAGYGGEVWGVNSSNRVYKYNGASGWTDYTTNTGQLLKYVSVGQDGVVWGVDANNYVYRLNGCCSWQSVAGRLKQISVGAGGEVWGVGTDDRIYRRDGGSWVQPTPSSRLKHVSVGAGVDGGEVWGVNSSNNIYRYNGINWTQIPRGSTGGLKQVSVGMNGEVWGVGTNDKIYRYDDPGWDQVPGGLKHVSSGFHEEIWGVSSNDYIWRLKNF